MKNEAGCQTCDCRECRKLKCVACASGVYKKDQYGCPTCECEDGEYCNWFSVVSWRLCPLRRVGMRQRESLLIPLFYAEKPVDCAPLTCKMSCKLGLVQDSRGCHQCKCKESCLSMCRMYCPYGYKTDETGCKLCSCLEAPVAMTERGIMSTQIARTPMDSERTTFCTKPEICCLSGSKHELIACARLDINFKPPNSLTPSS